MKVAVHSLHSTSAKDREVVAYCAVRLYGLTYSFANFHISLDIPQ